MRRLVVTLVGVACLSFSAQAGAATTFGSNLANPANGHGACGFGFVTSIPRFCLVSQEEQTADVAPGGLRAPSDGVIVRWRMKSGTTNSDITQIDVGLRLLKGDTRGATGELVSFPLADPGIHTYASRLPVKAGDRIGLDSYTTSVGKSGGDLPVTYEAPDAGLFNQYGTMMGSDPPSYSTPGIEVLLQAELEPDADHDGYGDETQDRCPTSSASQAPCATGDRTPPTAVTSVAATQDFIKDKEVVVGIKSNEAGTVSASGKLKIKGAGKEYSLAAVTQVVAADKKAKLHLEIGGKALKAAKRALGNGKKVKAVITLQATDAAGNAGAAIEVTVKPKPPKRHK